MHGGCVAAHQSNSSPILGFLHPPGHTGSPPRGPFDLLRFEVQSDDQAWDVRGLVLPYADDEGQIGVRLGLSF